jgi:hypothetical protein
MGTRIDRYRSERRWLSLLSLAFFLLLTAACEENREDIPEIDFKYDYYPLEIGRSWTYQVDSLTFDPAIGGTALDSFRTYLREVIVDTISSINGNTIYRVEQFYRRHDSLPWNISKVLTMEQTERQALRTEDNLKFVKMPFPFRKGDRWDGNAFFDPFLFVEIRGELVQMFKEWDYRVIEANQESTIGGLTFEEVATFQNADTENKLERRFAQEKYARGIGLVYRALLIADTQCQVCCANDPDLCDTLSWRDKAEKGLIIRQELIQYEE